MEWLHVFSVLFFFHLRFLAQTDILLFILAYLMKFSIFPIFLIFFEIKERKKEKREVGFNFSNIFFDFERIMDELIPLKKLLFFSTLWTNQSVPNMSFKCIECFIMECCTLDNMVVYFQFYSYKYRFFCHLLLKERYVIFIKTHNFFDFWTFFVW